jgi:hypothetical protein
MRCPVQYASLSVLFCFSILSAFAIPAEASSFKIIRRFQNSGELLIAEAQIPAPVRFSKSLQWRGTAITLLDPMRSKNKTFQAQRNLGREADLRKEVKVPLNPT